MRLPRARGFKGAQSSQQGITMLFTVQLATRRRDSRHESKGLTGHWQMIASLAMWLTLVDHAKCGQPDDLARSFQTNAPAQWKAYREFARQLDGKVDVRTDVDGKWYNHIVFELRHNSTCRLWFSQ